MKFLIDLYMDGYETEEDQQEACAEFIEEQLDFSASSVKILWAETPGVKTEVDLTALANSD